MIVFNKKGAVNLNNITTMKPAVDERKIIFYSNTDKVFVMNFKETADAKIAWDAILYAIFKGHETLNIDNVVEKMREKKEEEE